MSKVYTYADKQGGRLYVREAWKDGEVVVNAPRIIDDYEFELFVPAHATATADSHSIYGQPLSRVMVPSVRELSDFSDAHSGWEIHGMEDPLSQFLAREYPQKLAPSLDLFSVMNIDIEVEHSNGFPDPVRAEQEVLSITMKRFGQPSISLGLEQLNRPGYFKCHDEADLLETFLTFYERRIPDIITGWNVELFDITYLVNRISKILDSKAPNRLSPFAGKCRNPIQEKTDYRGEAYYKILGVTTVDYLELYKKFSPDKQESYRLGYIAEEELGDTKVDLEPWGNSLMRLYREDFPTFIEYNEKDVLLVERLDDKLQFLLNLVAITFMVKGRVEDSQATVKPWDTLLYNMILPLGMQPPPHPKPSASQIVGGFVKEPIPGLEKWVVVFDLASLYPNIARTLNMSPETIAIRGLPCIEEILAGLPLDIQPGMALAANGSQYRQDKVGIIPMAMGFLLDQRNVVKGEMKVEKKLKEAALANRDKAAAKAHEDNVSRLNATQLALKILANGGYGAIANRFFRYFDVDIAEGITMTGQTVIRFVAAAINAKMNELMETVDVDYVLGSDTDSCMTSIAAFMEGYIEACGMPANYNDLIDVADQFVQANIERDVLEPRLKELATQLGSINSTLSMKREAIADRGLFRAKKHYVLQVWDNEGVRYTEPDMKMVGIETARTTTPKICKEMLTTALKIILNGEEADLKREFKVWKETFATETPQKIGFPRGVSEINKWADPHGNPIKKTPIGAKAALAYNKLLKQHNLLELDPIKEGSKLKFVYLRHNNPTGMNVVGFMDEIPAQFDLDHWIDRDIQFEKALTIPLQSFTSLVDWHVVKARPATLDDSWFDEEYDAEQTPTVAARPSLPPVKTREPSNRAPKPSAKSKKQPKPTLDSLFG